MGSRSTRFVLWALVLLLVATPLATLGTAQASSPNYTLSGTVRVANGAGFVKAGVTVELIQSVTHQTLKATTGSGGAFSFTTASTGSALAPGTWGLWVPAQTNLSLGGTYYWAVLPSTTGPTYQAFTSSQLTSSTFRVATSASLYQLTTTVTGTLTSSGNGCSPSDATVQIVSPSLAGFAINSTTSNATGVFSFHAPSGTWLLEAYCSAAVTWYNVMSISVPNGGSTSVGSVPLSPLFAQGDIYDGSSGNLIGPAGNVTLYDTSNGNVLSGTVLPGGFYTVPTTPGSGPWTVLVNPIGYGTVGYTTSTAGITRDVDVNPISVAGQYGTTIAFGAGFSTVGVWTNATLGNNSVFSDLANASVGQLWSQLGLDFNSGSLSFSGTGAGATAFQGWLASQGAFWAPDQANLKVNGSTFATPTGYTYTAPTLPSGSVDYTSGGGLSMAWSEASNATTGIPSGGSGQLYTISFGFRYPVGPLAYNYTISLPAGYALAASTAKPSNSVLVPTGPDGSWKNFTLVAKPVPVGQSAYGTANFTVVKYGAISANVNVTVASFDFSSNNVLNSTRGNYTVVVGAGQNVTFSAQNSTYPDGTNGTSFLWNFGGPTQTTSTPTAYHTYGVAGRYVGSVNVTSSGGRTSEVPFTILVGNSPPTAVIASNATAAQQFTSGGVKYLLLNWSTTLQFNITGSSSILASNLTSPAGVLNVAAWSLTATSFNRTANYTAASGALVNSNFTLQFLGNGRYFKGATIGGQPVTFQGWWYNLTLTLWDGQGHSARATLPILVKDTQPPVPVIALQNSRGVNITSSGIVEQANHTALVTMNGQYSYDPNNGSVARYSWHITNSGNTSVAIWYNTTATKWSKWLDPQAKAYTVNLTVTDLAGNTAYTTSPLTVSVNATTRPILTAANLTAPSTTTQGSSYTVWGNVTNSGGTASTADNVVVTFYLLKPSGSGSRVVIVPTKDVKFYSYTSGIPSSSPIATGTLPTLAYNTTVRAEISWSPGLIGNYNLWMNATSTNEFSANYGPNQVSAAVTINQNMNTTYLYIGIIAAVVVVIIVLVVLVVRRGGLGGLRRSGGGKSGSSSSSKSGLERGGKKSTPEKDEDDDDDDT